MAKKTSIINKEGFVATVNELAKKQVALDKLKAVRDLEIQRVQERHSPEFESLGEEVKALYDNARLYAEDNRAELFPDAKTKTAHTELATFRFFLTPPKIAALNRKFDDERSIGLMEASKRLAAFVRDKKEIDREALLAAIAETSLAKDDLEAVGLKHSQTEKFEVKPLVESGERIAA